MANQTTEDDVQEWVHVRSLTELDELIGTRLLGETPATWWKEESTESLFPTLEEAVEALLDPYCRKFLPPEVEGSTCLKEVREFRRYSSDLSEAWRVVKKVSGGGNCCPLRLQWDDDHGWAAAFGQGPAIVSEQAPVAICVAALRAKGIAVEIDEAPDIEARF